MGVKHFVGNMAARLLKELSVDGLDSLALMRLSEREVSVRFIERLASDTLEVDKVANACGLAGLTAAVFEEQASAALGNAYCVWLSGELAQQEEPDARYLEQFQKTISAENAAEAVPFLDESGALWLCGKVYQPAGGDYHEVLLPQTGYETSEFYSALLEKLG